MKKQITKKEILDSTYKLVSALYTIEEDNNINKLNAVLNGLGYTNERLQEVAKYIDANVSEEEVNSNAEKQSFFSYVEALQEIENYISIAKGYEEMGEINLTTAQEDYHLEEEGARLYEVDKTAGKGSNQAG